jgi:predicted O-linked N-acetylglucosamine transferase (SPINDLY family)
MREDVPVPQYAPCTKRDYVVFGTICRWQDVNDDMLKIWQKILERVPKSAMLIRAEEFTGNSAIDNAYERMKKLGFNMDQILFRPTASNYMEEMTHLDVILDPYPYVGRSLTLDALYMGVPIVTFYGERRTTRAGLSILKQLGLEGLAVPINSQQAYIDRAVGLVSDLGTLDTLHKNLRTMIQKAMTIRPKRYCQLLEEKYEQILNEKS